MIDFRAEGSLAQTTLTCREVVQVLRDAFGRVEMTRAGEQPWQEMNVELLLVHANKWTLTIYNVANELNYCEWCLDTS